MKKLPHLILFLLFALHVTAQQYNELRYKQRIFPSSTAQNNITYASSPQWVFPYWNETLKLNVYQPTGDIVTNRPLVILAHAGGFLNGSKDVSNMLALCDSLARLGYVTATIDYRKGFNPLDSESAERAVYRGIQDGKAAVRFFKANATTYGIDTNYIYFGGMSAGGYIALHVAYMDLESERPASTYGGGTVNDLGCLDCAGGNTNKTSKVRAILDFWGAVQDTTIINSGDIPLMIMHGENDPTVPFDVGHPFGLGTLPETYGGWPVVNRAANLGLDYEFYTSSGNLHMLDGSDNGTFNSSNPANAFWYDTLLPRTRGFLYRMTKPAIQLVTPQQQSLCFNEQVALQVTAGLPYYKWYLPSTGVGQALNTNTNQLEISFDMAGTYQIGVIAFNEVYCPSDTLWFQITNNPPVQADFTTNPTIVGSFDFANSSVNAVSYQWSFGDGASATIENPSHSYTANGSYTVQLVATDVFGCTDTITQQAVVSTLSVAEQLVSYKVNTFPNPFSDQLLIESTLDMVSVEIVDLQGKQVYKSEIPQTTLLVDTQKWNAGMYLVKCTLKNGQEIIQKVVK